MSVARLTLIMPTVSGSGEEVESQDEVKVFKYEGDEEESEKRSSENLTEDKSSLITETEEVRMFTPANLSSLNFCGLSLYPLCVRRGQGSILIMLFPYMSVVVSTVGGELMLM